MRKAKSSVSVPTYFALTGYGHCNELAHLVVYSNQTATSPVRAVQFRSLADM